MYIYFDTNGTIKEVINDESIRKGSSDYNKIYCYLEGNPDIDDIWYLQKNPDGTLTNEVSFVDNIVTKAIPYDSHRDMKYFQDFEEYQFYVFTLSSSYLLQDGLVVATIRVAENNTLWALGELTFNVQANVINSDNDITQSQYDYLLLSYASRTLNEQTGSDLDELLDEKIEAKANDIIEPIFNDYKATIDEEVESQNETIASLSQAGPSVFDTASNITALTENKGVAVATDTGYIYYWDSTLTTPAYVSSGLQYNNLSDYVKHSGNQLKDSNGNDIYPEIGSKYNGLPMIFSSNTSVNIDTTNKKVNIASGTFILWGSNTTRYQISFNATELTYTSTTAFILNFSLTNNEFVVRDYSGNSTNEIPLLIFNCNKNNISSTRIENVLINGVPFFIKEMVDYGYTLPISLIKNKDISISKVNQTLVNAPVIYNGRIDINTNNTTITISGDQFIILGVNGNNKLKSLSTAITLSWSSYIANMLCFSFDTNNFVMWQWGETTLTNVLPLLVFNHSGILYTKVENVFINNIKYIDFVGDSDRVKCLFLGDSITTSSSGDYSWVARFNEMLYTKNVGNSAVGGAVLTDYNDTVLNGVLDFQNSNSHQNTLCNEVQRVLNGTYASNPDIIMIAIGTNGGLNELTYQDIQNTYYNNTTLIPLENVDRTTTAGAFRWATEKLQLKFPNAIIFYCCPIAGNEDWRPQLNVIKYESILEMLTKYADIELIHTNLCGINGTNEHPNQNGTYLRDGLHPNEKAAKLIGYYNATKVKEYLEMARKIRS